MTYYQKKKIIAKLKRAQNHVKHREYPFYPSTVICSGSQLIDDCITSILMDDNTVSKPLLPSVWKERRHEKV